LEQNVMTEPARLPHPPRRLLLLGGAAVLVAGGAGLLWPRAAGLPDPTDPRTTLAQVEDAVARILPVPEITAAELAVLVQGDRRLVLLDVREAEEFAQSRIPGAIRVPPGLPAADILARHGAAMTGAAVVFYCAVGWRSGLMVEALRDAANRAGAASFSNLRGGIFRWHAEGRALDTAPGAQGVHHFDAAWGQLLRRTLAN
jgi:rhodanese-related sulfurtransferase